MRLDTLLAELECIRMQAEDLEDVVDPDLILLSILDRLLEYIDNPKVEEAINDIPF
jgi:hypothetical protein